MKQCAKALLGAGALCLAAHQLSAQSTRDSIAVLRLVVAAEAGKSVEVGDRGATPRVRELLASVARAHIVAVKDTTPPRCFESERAGAFRLWWRATVLSFELGADSGKATLLWECTAPVPPDGTVALHRRELTVVRIRAHWRLRTGNYPRG